MNYLLSRLIACSMTAVPLVAAGWLPTVAIAQTAQTARTADGIPELAAEATRAVDDVIDARIRLGLEGTDEGAVHREDLLKDAAELLSSASQKAVAGNETSAVRDDYVQALRLLHAAFYDAMKSGNLEEASAMRDLIPVLTELDRELSPDGGKKSVEQ